MGMGGYGMLGIIGRGWGDGVRWQHDGWNSQKGKNQSMTIDWFDFHNPFTRIGSHLWNKFPNSLEHSLPRRPRLPA